MDENERERNKTAYIMELEHMGGAAMKVYQVLLTGKIPSDSLEELRQAFVTLGWLDEEEGQAQQEGG